MFKLIKNIRIYNPDDLGVNDVLLCHDKIVKIEKNIEYKDAEIIDKEGYIMIPGIIDSHIHITGGGGEGGFHTRTPEVMLSDLVKGGVTTCVGLLGTDSLTRSMEDLVAKTKALKNEGLTVFCLTGAYTYPSPTLTGSISKDIAFIDEVIGLKLAISDHRESHINSDEFKKIASSVRVAGMVSGKGAYITLHLGDDIKKLDMIFKVLNETSIPINHFRPTHVNRNKDLFNESLLFLEKGGVIDITVGNNHEDLLSCIQKIQNNKLPLNKVTFSSDGNGSWSKYNQEGKLIEIGVSSCDGILKSMQYLINKGLYITDVIQHGTTNVAHALNIAHYKGYIKTGYDADLLILDTDFNIDTVIAKGKTMMLDENMIVKGTYEN